MGNRVYVGNLSFDVSPDQLRSAFAKHGEVTHVHIMTDSDSGRPRGFAFITMRTPEEAAKAIERMNGTTLDGRPLRVNEAQERRHGDAERGGRRGGGFGGGSSGDHGRRGSGGKGR
jgi:RNA recognition motif-containing protein